ncbi:MAG: hypothetical protein L6R37_005153 [Teloschistes peruensis]|nr:MAG: hypothetical protein L6R37_005153 [Teloschistes peruensis]
MPPFRPFLRPASGCLRASTRTRSKPVTPNHLNLPATRGYASKRSGLPRSLIPVLLIAVASGGILAYSASAGNVPLNLEEPALPPNSPLVNPSSPSINPTTPTTPTSSPSALSTSVASRQSTSSTSSSPSNKPSTPLVVSEDLTQDLVQTGTSTIPFFPRTIRLPTTTPSLSTTATRTLPYGTGPPPDQQGEEYQLLGLGIRTVSFFRIQVYVVGLYVAKSSLPALQESLVRAFFTSSAAGDSTVSAATTLVEDEKTQLKRSLLGDDDGRGEKIWDEVLRNGGVKSVLRIVPTRSTDYSHMRDGWVRSVDARSGPQSKTKDGVMPENQRAGLQESIAEFRSIFGGGRKGIEKGKVLLLQRDRAGELGVWLERDGEKVTETQLSPGQQPQRSESEQRRMVEVEKERKRKMEWVGGMKDERISRFVWLGYLAGGSVASSGTRESVVDGVMEIVERPIGTIGTQVL